MTDRNAILKALTRAIRNELPATKPMDYIAPDVAAAVLELVGPKPLVWDEVSTILISRIDSIRTVTGEYSIRETSRGYYIVFFNGHPLHPAKHGAHFSYGLLAAAQAAAQAHANAAHWSNTPIGKLVGVV